MLSLNWEQMNQEHEQKKKLGAFKCLLHTIL